MAMIRLVILSLCLLGCTSTGDSPEVKVAEEPAAEAPTAKEPTDAQVEQAVAQYNESVTDKKDKIICRRERVVGTHFSRRICRTVHQMEEDRAAARTLREDQLDPASGGN